MGLLDFFKGVALTGVDSLNVFLNPHDRFTRPAAIVDHHTLKAKASIAHANVTGSWLYGKEGEFYWHERPNGLGDMAIWHGHWAGTCFLMKDMDYAKGALRGLRLLQYLGGGRIARGADVRGGAFKHDTNAKYYFASSGGTEYSFIQNCSESSLVGFLFAWWAYIMSYGMSGTLWPGIKQDICNLADKFIDDGYCLRNVGGECAKFGSLKPSVFTAPQRAAAGAALMCLADYVAPAGNRYGKAFALYWRTCKSSLLHPEQHFLAWDSPTDDFIAYVYLAIFCTLCQDSRVRAFRDAMRNQMRKNRNWGNPYFNFMYGIAVNQMDGYLQETAIKTMNEFNMAVPSLPNAKTAGSIDLTGDRTIPNVGPSWRTGNKILARQPVPIWKRKPADILMQRNPYVLKGSEVNNYNFMEYLMLYELGKLAGAI